MRLIVLVAAQSDCAAMTAILRALPAGFPIPIAVVYQRPAGLPDSLPVVLRRITPLEVVPLTGPTVALRPGTIYVAPVDFHAYVDTDGRLALADGAKIRGQSSSAVPLLVTAAIELGGGVAAVVLPGGEADAADGIEAVAKRGGVVLETSAARSRASTQAISDALVRLACSGAATRHD